MATAAGFGSGSFAADLPATGSRPFLVRLMALLPGDSSSRWAVPQPEIGKAGRLRRLR